MAMKRFTALRWVREPRRRTIGMYQRMKRNGEPNARAILCRHTSAAIKFINKNCLSSLPEPAQIYVPLTEEFAVVKRNDWNDDKSYLTRNSRVWMLNVNESCLTAQCKACLLLMPLPKKINSWEVFSLIASEKPWEKRWRNIKIVEAPLRTHHSVDFISGETL